MLRKILFVILIQVTSLIASKKEPQIIDLSFGATEEVVVNYDAWKRGLLAFNFSPELTPFFDLLRTTYGIKTVIESGTYEGATTALFASLFNTVYTIEIVESLYNYSKNKLAIFPNVHCHFGDSRNFFNTILSKYVNEPIFFYLDAHGQGEWPLLGELEAISKTHRDNCVVVIDDFKVPGRSDIPYDSYGADECCLEYVQEKLGQIFSDYNCFILLPKHLYWRAKFVAIPKHWDLNQIVTQLESFKKSA